MTRITVSSCRTARALAVANARYWPTVLPLVRRELRRWRRHALAIPDHRWRTIALAKLQSEAFNAEVAATVATLAPLRHRSRTVRAIVALEVLYDYLDGAHEHAAHQYRGGEHLFDAFVAAIAGPPDLQTSTGYYRDLPGTDDGGYLAALASTCHTALDGQPAAEAVRSAATVAAMRCAHAQRLTHEISRSGPDRLRRWSIEPARDAALMWWEYAAGSAASVLPIHALLAAAADTRTTPADAAALDRTYFLAATLSTLLDSLVDAERDTRLGEHSFIGYYASPTQRTIRIAHIAHRATASAGGLPHAAHHAMAIIGVAGYYLSAPTTTTDDVSGTRSEVRAAVGQTATPILAIFATWRALKHVRAGRAAR